MIANCPECQTRYKVADERIGPQGARIRCQKCQTVFAVQLPVSEPELEAQPIEFVACALVAEADAETAKQVAAFLEQWGVEAKPIENGAEALLTLHRDRFDFAFLGAALPAMTAPAICEILRRNADLQEMSLVRILGPGEVPAGPEFDADLVLDRADLPGALREALESFGVGRAPAAPKAPATPPAPAPKPAAQPASAPAAAKAPAPAPSAPAKADASGLDSADLEVKAAERLARIVVSDIILYNEEKFAAAAVNAPEALAAELEEAGRMFAERVSEELRSKRDFLVDELHRRADKLTG